MNETILFFFFSFTCTCACTSRCSPRLRLAHWRSGRARRTNVHAIACISDVTREVRASRVRPDRDDHDYCVLLVQPIPAVPCTTHEPMSLTNGPRAQSATIAARRPSRCTCTGARLLELEGRTLNALVHIPLDYPLHARRAVRRPCSTIRPSFRSVLAVNVVIRFHGSRRLRAPSGAARPEVRARPSRPATPGRAAPPGHAALARAARPCRH